MDPCRFLILRVEIYGTASPTHVVWFDVEIVGHKFVLGWICQDLYS